LLCQRSDRIFSLVKAVLAGSRVRALRVAAALPRLWQAGWFALVCLIAVAAAAQQPQERTYREGRYHKGELKYVNDLPVLIVEGTPTEIGEQKAVLTGDAAKVLAGYPKKLLKQLGREDQWPKVLEMGELLAPQFPPDHREELRAFADKAGVGRDDGIAANTLIDTYRGGFGCSSLIVEPERSATGGPIFGRNLDFHTLGVLEQYSLVTVHRPKGKRAFASIGFPGLFGCLSGINDAGLALAVHEVLLSRDQSPLFNPKGVPYAICFRRILEECSTVAEAERLLRSCQRTTKLNLALCDRNEAGVLEMTPKTVAFRGAEDGVCACTNHFRTKELVILPLCRRYNILQRYFELERLDLADVSKALNEVNQGRMTVQTMIFEPALLVLHLAIGSCPSSAQPLQRLDLKPLLLPAAQPAPIDLAPLAVDRGDR